MFDTQPEELVWYILRVTILFMLCLHSPLVQCLTLVSIEEKRCSRTSPTTSSDMITKKPWKSESKIFFFFLVIIRMKDVICCSGSFPLQDFDLFSSPSTDSVLWWLWRMSRYTWMRREDRLLWGQQNSCWFIWIVNCVSKMLFRWFYSGFWCYQHYQREEGAHP